MAGASLPAFPPSKPGRWPPHRPFRSRSHFSIQFKVACRFTFDQPVIIQDSAVTTHLYRIAQEAVHNSIRHGKARNIGIHLAKAASFVTLTIRDDGSASPLLPRSAREWACEI